MSTGLNDILTIWFGSARDHADLKPQPFWFKSTPELDKDISRQFMGIYDAAINGTYDENIKTPEQYLAIILLFDQFPRNMFRGTPQAFATDAKALEWAKKALELGFDQKQISMHRRIFFYMPFEHSENLDDQNQCVHLIEQLGEEGYTRFAEAHRDVIQKYGRFPHRNAILGRDSTPEELIYLGTKGAGF